MRILKTWQRVIVLWLFGWSANAPANGHDLLYPGAYQVVIKHPQSWLNCREEPGLQAVVVARYRNGEPLQALSRVDTPEPWFETAQGCFVRASGAWLRWQEVGEDPSTMCDPRTEPC